MTPAITRAQQAALAHLPCAGRVPLAADIRLLRDALRFTREVHRRCGPVSWTQLGGQPQVLLLSPQAAEQVLLDREQRASARWGWEPLLGELFPRGLMLRDGEDHRLHRRLMLPAMRRDMLALYLRRMQAHTEAAISNWMGDSAGAGATVRFPIYPHLKRLTLAMATDVFLGVHDARDVAQVDRDFHELVEASTAIVRMPMLGRKYARGLKARARLAAFLHERVRERRHGLQLKPAAESSSQAVDAGSGHLLGQLCEARTEEGEHYSEAEVVDHLIFLLMAAHDTTTSALTTMIGLLADHPDWQERLRAEALALSEHSPGPEAVLALQDHGLVFKEALRLYPPVPMITRRAAQEMEVQGHRIPAGALMSVFPVFIHRDAHWWSRPDEFDPLRFSPERSEQRTHPQQWLPFGGGAHMCLGMHFAELQAKAILSMLLQRLRWSGAGPASAPFTYAPIAHPRNGLPLRLSRI